MEIESDIEISIVVPTKNRKAFIEEFTIPSLRSQTFKRFEAIFVDDSDTDETERYLKTVKDINIVYLRGRNCLIAGARNDGMKKARGGYIAHLDDDEIWFENKLEACLNALKNNRDYLFAYHKSYKRKLGDSTLEEWLPDWDKDYLFNVSNIIPCSNVLMEKGLFDKYGGFSEDIRIFPRCDWEYWARLIQYTEFLFIPQFLGIYQEHPDSIVISEKRENSQLTSEHNEFIRIYIQKYHKMDTCTIARDRVEMQRKLDELWLRIKFQWDEIEKSKNLVTGMIETDSNMQRKIDGISSQITLQSEEIEKNRNFFTEMVLAHSKNLTEIENVLKRYDAQRKQDVETTGRTVHSIQEEIARLHDVLITYKDLINQNRMNQEGQIKKLDDKLTSALYKLNDMYTSRLFQIYRWLQKIFSRRRD